MDHENGGEQKSYVPASPLKRTLAWIGLIYMLILLALTTFFYFTGKALMGIAPLLAVPGLLGLGIAAQVSSRTTGNPKKSTALLLTVLFVLLALAILPDGIARLMANFQE